RRRLRHRDDRVAGRRQRRAPRLRLVRRGAGSHDVRPDRHRPRPRVPLVTQPSRTRAPFRRIAGALAEIYGGGRLLVNTRLTKQMETPRKLADAIATLVSAPNDPCDPGSIREVEDRLYVRLPDDVR